MKKKIRVEIACKGIKKKNIYDPFIRATIEDSIGYLIANRSISKKIMKNKNTIDVLLCSNREIRELNKKYRDLDKETNELSFSYLDDKNTDYIGGIVINWDEVIRDSDETFYDRKLSLLNFISHAILHIFGYTHDTEDKEKEMEKIKLRLIKKLKKALH